jgi:hypothetical protein
LWWQTPRYSGWVSPRIRASRKLEARIGDSGPGHEGRAGACISVWLQENEEGNSLVLTEELLQEAIEGQALLRGEQAPSPPAGNLARPTEPLLE